MRLSFFLLLLILISPGRLLHASPGAVDPTFDLGSSVNSDVEALVAQPDGKIIIAGYFTTVRGAARNCIARLNVDGTVDPTFNPDAALYINFGISSLALQTDGKVLVGGIGLFARLNTDGSLDNSFLGNSSYPDIYSILVQTNGQIVVGGYTTIARLNPNGSNDASFDPGTGPDDTILSIASNPDGKLLIGGRFTSFNGTNRNNIARLNTNGSLDTSFNADANGWVRSIVVQTDKRILLGGDFTTVNTFARNRLARLNEGGTFDSSFNPGTGASSSVNSIALQPDGMVIVGGSFNTINATNRSGIARLNSNGTLDTTFDPSSPTVNSIALRADGKMWIGGSFQFVGSTPRCRVALVKADGTLDNTFNPGNGIDDGVRRILVQSDRKVLLAGTFASINSTKRLRLARLNADGTLDGSFDSAASGIPYDLARKADGKIVLGGFHVGGTNLSHVAQFNSDGSTDTNFAVGSGPDWIVYGVAAQADGKIILGGSFTNINGTARPYLARLNTNGTVDVGFNAGSFGFEPPSNLKVECVALQTNGMILAGGNFTNIAGLSRCGIARFTTNGTLDLGFDSSIGANGPVDCMTLQSDGEILISGSFGMVDNLPRYNIARLHSNGHVDTSFVPDALFGHIYNLLPADGKVLVAGDFPKGIARLTSDGHLDTTFNVGAGVDNLVYSVALQANGKILIGGYFGTVNGLLRPVLARLMGDSPVLNMQRVGSSIVLDWNNTAFSLQSAPAVTGSFTNIPSATSPYSTSINGSPRFFRLQDN